MRERRFHFRILLPLALLLLALWLLVGCLYIPWSEFPTKGNDFRPYMAEPGETPNRPITPGHITRDQLRRLLGPPEYASVDNEVVAYVFHTASGWWVAPLCFTASPGNGRVYVGRFRFDDAGVLESTAVISESTESGIPVPQMLASRVPLIIARYNQSGPELLPSWPIATTRRGVTK